MSTWLYNIVLLEKNNFMYKPCFSNLKAGNLRLDLHVSKLEAFVLWDARIESQASSVKLLLRYCIFIFQSFKVCECYTWWFLILVIQLYLCLSIFVICFVLILRWLAKGFFEPNSGLPLTSKSNLYSSAEKYVDSSLDWKLDSCSPCVSLWISSCELWDVLF